MCRVAEADERQDAEAGRVKCGDLLLGRILGVSSVVVPERSRELIIARNGVAQSQRNQSNRPIHADGRATVVCPASRTLLSLSGRSY
jgi:hypothetical protein